MGKLKELTQTSLPLPELEEVVAIMMSYVEKVEEDKLTEKTLVELAKALWAKRDRTKLSKAHPSMYKTRNSLFKKCILCAKKAMPEAPIIIAHKVQTVVLVPDKVDCSGVVSKGIAGNPIQVKKISDGKIHSAEETKELLVSEGIRDTVAAGILGLAGIAGALGADYTIQPGDALGKIANKFNVSISDIVKANPRIKDKNKIFVGQKIKIPDKNGLTNSPKEPKAVEPEAVEDPKQDVSNNIPQKKEKKKPSPRRNGVYAYPQGKIPYGGKIITYTIKPGDSFSKIADMYGDTSDRLTTESGLNPGRLRAGTKIFVIDLNNKREKPLSIPDGMYDHLRRAEDVKLDAYRNTYTNPDTNQSVVDKWTIGYGNTEIWKNNEWRNVRPSDKLKDNNEALEQCMLYIQKRIMDKYINRMLTVDIPKDALIAVISFLFNTGEANAKKLLPMINEGKIDEAVAYMMKHNKSNGVYINGLGNRRTSETELFKSAFDAQKRANKQTVAESILSLM